VFYHAIRHAECVEKLDPSLVCDLNRRLQHTPLWLAVEQGANKLIKRLFDIFPQALHIAAENGLTPYDVAAKNQIDFAVDFFMPKLTFEDNVRAFLMGNPMQLSKGMASVCALLSMCNIAKVLNPTLTSTIYSYLGFGTLLTTQRKE